MKTPLGRIKAAGLSLTPSKCKFGSEEIKILGKVVTKGKVKPDLDKVKAIEECRQPGTIRELRAFLGLSNYCRDFMPRFAEIAGLMINRLKGKQK